MTANVGLDEMNDVPLVGVQTGVVTVEIGMEIAQKKIKMELS